MLGVRQSLIDPRLEHASIQDVTGVAHGHDVLHSRFKGSPVCRLVLTQARHAILGVGCQLLGAARLRRETLAAIDIDSGLGRRCVHIVAGNDGDCLFGAIHPPDHPLVANLGLAGHEVAAAAGTKDKVIVRLLHIPRESALTLHPGPGRRGQRRDRLGLFCRGWCL